MKINHASDNRKRASKTKKKGSKASNFSNNFTCLLSTSMDFLQTHWIYDLERRETILQSSNSSVQISNPEVNFFSPRCLTDDICNLI